MCATLVTPGLMALASASQSSLPSAASGSSLQQQVQNMLQKSIQQQISLVSPGLMAIAIAP
jgi:hypothetical protein